MGILAIACTSPPEKQARQLFKEHIAVIDSCYNEFGRYWEQDELTESEMRQKTEKWLVLVTSMDEEAQKAAEIIAPYDSLLSVAANNCHETASDAAFYADQFLHREGSAYFDKFQTWLGHLGTALQEIHYLIEEDRW